MELRIFAAPPPTIRPRATVAPPLTLPAVRPYAPVARATSMPPAAAPGEPGEPHGTAARPHAPPAAAIASPAQATTPAPPASARVTAPALTLAATQAAQVANANDVDPVDREARAILARPLAYGESVAAAYAHKERDLASLFAALAPGAALALHARLSSPRADDALAAEFARLVADRRARLLAVLAAAPRRAALAGRALPGGRP